MEEVDSLTLEKSVTVNDGGATGPYLMVPKPLLPEVRSILDRNQINHWVSPILVGIGGEPVTAFVHTGRKYAGMGPRLRTILGQRP